MGVAPYRHLLGPVRTSVNPLSKLAGLGQRCHGKAEDLPKASLFFSPSRRRSPAEVVITMNAAESMTLAATLHSCEGAPLRALTARELLVYRAGTTHAIMPTAQFQRRILPTECVSILAKPTKITYHPSRMQASIRLCAVSRESKEQAQCEFERRYADERPSIKHRLPAGLRQELSEAGVEMEFVSDLTPSDEPVVAMKYALICEQVRMHMYLDECK